MSDQVPCPKCGHLVFPSRPGSKFLPEEVDADHNYSPHTKARCETWKKLAMARDMMKGLKILFACTVPLESQWVGLCDSWSQRIAEFEGKPEVESASPCRDCGSQRKAGVLHTASECRDALVVRRDALVVELEATRARMLERQGLIERTTRHYNHYTPGRSDDFERELARQAGLAKPVDATQQEAARDEAYRAGLTKGFYLAVAHVELSNRDRSYAEKKLKEALEKT